MYNLIGGTDEELELFVAKAKRRIVDLYYQTSGKCHLSFSGGKDSTVVLALIKECEKDGLIPKNAIPAVFCDTKVEMDAIVLFVEWVSENWYGNVAIISTEKSFGQVIKEYGKPMVSKMKSGALSTVVRHKEIGSTEMCKAKMRLLGINYGSGRYERIRLANKDLHMIHPDFDIRASNKCCHHMKKLPFERYNKSHNIEGYFTGERMYEGGARAYCFEMRAKTGNNICTRTRGNYTVKSPIVDWTDNVLERFIEKYNVPLSEAYTTYGLQRTGCFLCPYAQDLTHRLEALCKYEPKKYRAALGFLKDVYIAQGVKLEFDSDYMKAFNDQWPRYEKMRYEMLKKYRPDCRLVKKYEKEHQT